MTTENTNSEIANNIQDSIRTMLFGSLQEGVVICDSSAKIAYINMAAEAILELYGGAAIGRDISQVYVTLYEAGRSPSENTCRKVLETRLAKQNKRLLICIGQGGKEHLVFESAAPLFDDKNNFSGVILIIRDVSDIINEVRVPHKMESFKTLAGGMANDFNNLLTVITNSLFMARLDLDSKSEKYQILLSAEKAAVQANALTNQLLSIAGGGRPVMTEIDLRNVISEAAGFIITDNAVDYDITFDDNLALVHADRGMIDQAIGNVIKNAVQALPDGGEIKMNVANVSVDSSMPLPLSDGEYVKVSIWDNGKGIPSDLRERVFDPFFTTRLNGHGLGLSLAYAAIRQHGGHITVDSGESGTSVCLYLPSIKAQSAKPQKSPFKGRILFMDDEEMVRRSAQRILEYLGFYVELATDGDQALELYKKSISDKKPFDIVLLDLIVDFGRGGKEIVNDLLALNPNANVIISSGYVSDPVVVDYTEYGFKGAIGKPYNISELNALLSKFVVTE